MRRRVPDGDWVETAKDLLIVSLTVFYAALLTISAVGLFLVYSSMKG